VTGDVDLLVLAELNPDVLVSSGDVDIRFGQVEQLVENATMTLGSSGAITACAAAAQGIRVAVCAVVGDDSIGEWTAEQLRGHGVDVSGVIRRPGRQTGMSIVLTRADGDRAILTYSGTMPELTAADVPGDRLRAARHVHVSSFFLQRGLQAGLPGLFLVAREAGATTSLDTGWDPAGEWASALAALRDLHYLLPNQAECAHLAAALGGEQGTADGGYQDGEQEGEHDDAAVIRAAHALSRLGPEVAVKLGAAGALAVSAAGGTRVRGRAVTPVDTTGAGDCFNAGFIAGVLDGSTTAESLRRAAACGSFAVTGWGGTGRLATRAEALRAAAELESWPLPDPAG
jgi:sugar/nucleoside kinase (ribokinase family)